MNKISEITNAMCNKKSALAWKIVNEVSRRNNSYRAKCKANSGKEQIQLWNDISMNYLINHQFPKQMMKV